MDKEKQIKEMSKIVDEMYNVYTTTADDIAEGIYNAGYRKTFTSDLASDTQKAFKEGYEKGYDDGFEDGCNQGEKDNYDRGFSDGQSISRKETAKKILQEITRTRLYDNKKEDGGKRIGYFLSPENLEELTKKYGVEVEE